MKASRARRSYVLSKILADFNTIYADHYFNSRPAPARIVVRTNYPLTEEDVKWIRENSLPASVSHAVPELVVSAL